MLYLEIGLLPSGNLTCFSNSEIDEQLSKNPIVTAFSLHLGEGLFTLAATKNALEFSTSVRFWRELAQLYLTTRCHNPESQHQELSPIPFPISEGNVLLLNAPPMRGAEYLSIDILQYLWNELDQWLCSQIQTKQETLANFLESRAPHWRLVGRVCFHLAENKNDPDYPFAFLATYSSQLSSQGKAQHQPLGKALQEYAGARNKNALIRLLSPVNLASASSMLIKSLVDSGDLYHPLAWPPTKTFRFLKEVPLYEESGILVRLPDWWKKRSRLKVEVVLDQSKKMTQFSASSMLNFQVNLALGDQKVTQEEWDELMKAEDGLVLLKGEWVEVDKKKLSEALKHWKKLEKSSGEGISFIEGMRLLAGTPRELLSKEDVDSDDENLWTLIQAGPALKKILEGLVNPEMIEAIKPSPMLKTQLRPYQLTGFKWLWYLNQLGLGACLADDMGLGKTIQVISLLLLLKQKKSSTPSLLVLPASLLGNWKDELDKFAPTLKYRILHPSQTSKTELKKLATQKKPFADLDLVMTSYTMLWRQSWLLDLQWNLAVIDEAQAIKNPKSQQTQTVKKIKSYSRIALTGTPVENRLSDLWSIFDFLCPGLLGSASVFKEFTRSLEERKHQQFAPLKRLVQPYILRRLKTDRTIINDLPDKTEIYAYCYLSKEQGALYQKNVKELEEALDQAHSEMKRRGAVFAYLIRFKQICNHPSQLRGDGRYLPSESGKFSRLEEICEEIVSRQEKVLIFSQFREISGPIASFLTERFRQPALILTGDTPVKKRKTLVEQFQDEKGPPFFIISLKAGGVGLNLTAATHVIHFDRWWNPAVENQATDRAFRIGQKKNVLVHKFVSKGTIEENIDRLINEKSALARDLLENNAETLLTEMSNEDLLKLIALDINQVQD